MPGERTDNLLLFALLALNAVLKFSWLGVNELSGDEPFTVFQAQRSLPALFEMLRTENNPPLYFLLIKVWSAVVGLDEALLRIPSAFFSVLTVWPLWYIARRLGDRAMALTACLLFTFSFYHFRFAHEVRSYPLFCLLTVLSIWLVVRWTNNAGQRAWRRDGWTMIALALTNALLVYTHFFGWLGIGLQALCVTVLPAGHRNWRRFAVGAAGALLASAPYTAIIIGRAGESVREGTWVAPPRAEAIYNMVWNWSNAPVVAVSFLIAVAALLILRRANTPLARMALVWTFVPLFGLWLASQWVPVFVDRYLVFAAPGFTLLVAVALRSIWNAQGWKRALIPGIGVGGMAVTMSPWMDNGLKPSAAVIAIDHYSLPDAGLPVLIAPPWYALNHAWAEDRQLFRDPEHFTANLHQRSLFEVRNTDDLQGLPVNGKDGAIVVDAWSEVADPERSLHKALRARFPQVDSVRTDRFVRVYRYRR